MIQHTGLMPHRTIRQNMTTVPSLLGWEDARAAERVDELTEIFDLDPELLDRYPAELSGGQRQRVGVARALAADPPVMLMDEPFAAVDPIVRARLQDQFLDIQASLKKTIVFVTHDIDEAIKLSDRIAILNVGAVLEQFAPAEEILRDPANDFVREFVGAERGLKRLALIKVGDIEVEDGPVVSPAATAEQARAAIEPGGFDFVSVVDDGELLGWVDRDMLEGATTVADATPQPFSAYVTAHDSLRQALDSIVTSRTGVAVVASSGQRYQGILTLERISKEISLVTAGGLGAASAQSDTQPLVRWSWIADNLDEIASRGFQHVWLTFVSVRGRAGDRVPARDRGFTPPVGDRARHLDLERLLHDPRAGCDRAVDPDHGALTHDGGDPLDHLQPVDPVPEHARRAGLRSTGT